ncbi:30 kDa spicule matrix protein-like [Lytechinus variegatus]|uniref:30 kDa spicule matrix protein-like n=1 Tax=Lytechinus variegatus TaxID=7654 RepID=UPI001BB26C91|nr:30 kDa spicule matrix protein-like [Lytechinus variegatus]
MQKESRLPVNVWKIFPSDGKEQLRGLCRIIPFKYNRSPYVGGFQVAAHQECGLEQPGAGLVTINTVEENNFIFEWITRFASEPTTVWIGLFQPRVARQGPVWFSGERGILDLVEPLDYGEGAVLFLNDRRRYSPRWEGEDPFEWGSRPSALCEYKVTQAPPTTPPIAPTTKQKTIPIPGPSQQPPILPKRNFPRKPYFPSYHPFGPGPLSLHKPVGTDGFLFEVIRRRAMSHIDKRGNNHYKSGYFPIALP